MTGRVICMLLMPLFPLIKPFTAVIHLPQPCGFGGARSPKPTQLELLLRGRMMQRLFGRLDALNCTGDCTGRKHNHVVAIPRSTPSNGCRARADRCSAPVIRFRSQRSNPDADKRRNTTDSSSGEMRGRKRDRWPRRRVLLFRRRLQFRQHGAARTYLYG
jgi:hypothetical protein